MERAGHGLQILAAISLLILCIVRFAFVDDADLVEGAPDVKTPSEDLVAPFQQALNQWSGLLRATGGLLVPSKSRWWLVGFYFNGKDLVYDDPNDLDGELCVPDLHGTPVPIQQLHVSDAVESLGIWITADGNQKRQYEELLKKLRAFASQIQTSTCDKNSAMYSYQSSWNIP